MLDVLIVIQGDIMKKGDPLSTDYQLVNRIKSIILQISQISIIPEGKKDTLIRMLSKYVKK